MANILDTFKTYMTGKWTVKSEAKISKADAALIAEGTVVESEYGLSAKLLLVTGGAKYVPISRDSDLAEGDDIEPKNIVFIVLEKEGENDIVRLDMR